MRMKKIKLTEKQLSELNSHRKNKECTLSESNRIQAILMINHQINPILIEEFTGYSQKYAFELRKKYFDNGLKSLLSKSKKPRLLLTKKQREEIVETVTKKIPNELGYESDFWLTSILADYIKNQYGVHYKSKTTLYIIFKEAKFTYHKPDTQYKSRNQIVIDEWKLTNKSIIQDALNDPNTVVLTEDEMMLTTQTTTQKIWLPKGKFPKIDVSSKRQLRCIYGFLNIKTGQEHAYKFLRASSQETCQALKEVGKAYPGKKIVIIWDNASWHRSQEIKDFLRNTRHSFHLIQFPPYAPELNPQEHVWKAGRARITHNQFIEKIDIAIEAFLQYLNGTIFGYKFL